jgi:nucleoid-associated protein YgaU
VRLSTQVSILTTVLCLLLIGGVTAALVVDSGSSSASRVVPTVSPSAPASVTPSATPSSSPAPSPSASAGPTTAPVPRPTATPVPVYTVKPGDNLSKIARQYGLAGYYGLYLANKATIGKNPSLIRPGQVFQILDPRVKAMAIIVLRVLL